jgi:D-methionine transport system substrate-binding protein
MKKLFFALALFGVGFYFYANQTKTSTHSKSENVLKIGVTAGPHAAIVEYIKPLAKEKGIRIHLIEFDDFVLPNAALNQGDIHLNIYQHEPYLREQVQTRKYKIKALAKTVLMPMGAYSLKYTDILQLPEGAKIGIPNDPSNSVRALLLLEKAGLIKLDPDKTPSIYTLASNPKKLVLKELDPPFLPRALEDLDMAVINTDWVVVAKMNPKTAIIKEDTTSPYVNVIAAKEGAENTPAIAEFVALYQSASVKHFIKKTFQGAVIPVF